jgi:hypothetical protein
MRNTKRTYKLRPGRSLPIDVEILADRIEQIREAKGGPPVPSDLIADAEPPDSPLHCLFPWDDVEAADKWRRSLARDYLNCYFVIQQRRDGQTVKLIGNYSITIDKGKRGYADSFEIVNAPSFQEQQLKECRAALSGIVERYQNIESCTTIVEAVRRILALDDGNAHERVS